MNVFRGATAIVGIGQTPYYKRGTSPDPELKLALRAIVAACADAGIAPQDVDGFVSYGSERNDGQKLMWGLGTKELKFGALVWTHGGGIPGALGLAASAIIAGHAEIVVVYRAMAEGSNERLRVAVAQNDTAAQYLVNGMDGPAQICAMRSQRMIEYDGVPRSCLRDMAKAAYFHAKRNPNAYGRTVDLDDQTYEASRYISEPYRLFDCSRENDASAAVILVSAERAKDLAKKPAYVLSAPIGAPHGWGAAEENMIDYTSGGFKSVAKRLWAQSGYGPKDVDVAQIYENMTGMGVAAIIDHGFCTPETAGDFIRYENLIVPGGTFPVNTSGGNLADGFIHGMGLVNEAVRQIRGESPNQVADAQLSLVTGGPGDMVVSTALLGSAATL
ncbi:MAG: transporter [Hydrogenophilaceae bacterium]|jgi:acetyl-CoA acetyltransferase|nr:transporter [Hydrogenophilaceae bacterium]